MLIEQVAFWDYDLRKYLGGILLDRKTIICGECGGILTVGEDIQMEDVKLYQDWVDISDSIMGGELPQ